jgi:hypothetical protein
MRANVSLALDHLLVGSVKTNFIGYQFVICLEASLRMGLIDRLQMVLPTERWSRDFVDSLSSKPLTVLASKARLVDLCTEASMDLRFGSNVSTSEPVEFLSTLTTLNVVVEHHLVEDHELKSALATVNTPAGYKRVQNLVNSLCEDKTNFKPDATLGIPAVIGKKLLPVWFAPSEEPKKPRNANATEMVSQRGIYYGVGQHIVEYVFEYNSVNEQFRPNAMGGGNKRHSTEASSPKPPRSWGMAVDLDLLAANTRQIDGAQERISPPINIQSKGVGTRMLGKATDSKGASEMYDDVFLSRLLGRLEPKDLRDSILKYLYLKP